MKAGHQVARQVQLLECAQALQARRGADGVALHPRTNPVAGGLINNDPALQVSGQVQLPVKARRLMRAGATGLLWSG